jgi:hypothetical protein
MWKAMERYRKEDMERLERNRKEDMERLERNRKEDKENLGQLIREFKEDVEKMKESLSEKCEGRANKLAGDIAKLENKTENSIVEVNKKIRKVEEVQSQQMSEARVSHTAILTELTENKQGLTNSLSLFRAELSEVKNSVTAECLVVIGDKLDAANRDNISELGKIGDRLDRLEGRVAEAAGPAVSPSASAAIQVNDTIDRVQAELVSANIGTDGSRHSVDRCGELGDSERVGASPSQCDTYSNNNSDDVIVRVAGQGTPQFIHDLAKDIGLPKFTDPSKQYIVHFLNDLESYFQLRRIPDSLKLVIAKSAVVDNYTSQWINTVYRDLQNYHQFREAITEFLWGPQAQSKWRCALYQGKYDAGKDGSMTAHFLRYSAVASNLTPKITEAEMVDMISGHYPAYVQRTLLSAGVKTIRDVLNLLNRLESIETYEEENSNPGASARDTADSRNHFPRHRITPGFQNVRNMRYQGTRDNHAHRHRNVHRRERGGQSGERGVQEVQCRMVSQSDEKHKTLNATAKSYVPSSAVGESSSNTAKLDQGN